MKQAIVSLKSVSPYSQSKHYEVAKKNGESFADFEVRTWRHRMHSTTDGHVQIPPMAFSNCLKAAAKRQGLKIPGKGNKTYSKSFEAGLLVLTPMILPNMVEDVPSDCLFVPSDGIPGSGKRVTKYFPRIDAWEGMVTFEILDDEITRDVFEAVLRHAGTLTGIGRFRPERGGFYGRFSGALEEWIEL